MTDHLLIWLYLPAVFILSLALSVYLIPLLREAAIRWGMVDAPDGQLKQHKESVPYMGGLAVYIAFLITLAVATDFSSPVIATLLGGTMVVMVGLIDDFVRLRPGQKFLGQIIAALVVIKAGVIIDLDFIDQWPLLNSSVNIVVTLFWFLSLINAVNLIDIMDGLSGSVTMAACLVMGILALLNGSPEVAALAVALMGAILGFLLFNWRPARIFLGDTGAMFIGLMLGAMAVMLRYSETNPVAYTGPIMILGVPLFDTLLVMIARRRKGRSPFMGGPEHFALRLRRRGWSDPRIALSAGGATLLLGTAAVINTFVTQEWIALAIFAGVTLCGLVALGVFLRLPDHD